MMLNVSYPLTADVLAICGNQDDSSLCRSDLYMLVL